MTLTVKTAVVVLALICISTKCSCSGQNMTAIFDYWDAVRDVILVLLWTHRNYVILQVVSRHVQPGSLENVSLNVVDYVGIR